MTVSNQYPSEYAGFHSERSSQVIPEMASRSVRTGGDEGEASGRREFRIFGRGQGSNVEQDDDKYTMERRILKESCSIGSQIEVSAVPSP